MKKVAIFLAVMAGVSSLLVAQDDLVFRNKPQNNPYKQENTQKQTQNLSKEEKAVQCLNEKGFTMYAVNWCPHCKEQKHKLAKYLDQLNLVDCDKEKRLCRKKRITGYPTLLLEKENNKEINQGSLLELAQEANCKL